MGTPPCGQTESWMDGQTHVKTLPSRRTTYASGNKLPPRRYCIHNWLKMFKVTINDNWEKTLKAPSDSLVESSFTICISKSQFLHFEPNPSWLSRGQQVNFRNPLHEGDKAHKRGIHPGFESQAEITRGPVPHKKNLSKKKQKKPTKA